MTVLRTDKQERAVLRGSHLREMFAHARASAPEECCGFIGADQSGISSSVYRLRNHSARPHVAYEVEPSELFAAQRMMRKRGEKLSGIYHSHPGAADPLPSETDVKLAYYPDSTYFIIGLGGGEAVVNAFHISEREGNWTPVFVDVVEDGEGVNRDQSKFVIEGCDGEKG